MLCGIWAVNQTSRRRYLMKKHAWQHKGKVYESNLRPLKLTGVAVWVFFPDTNLRLPYFLFEYVLECMVSWLRRSKIWPHLTLPVAALLGNGVQPPCPLTTCTSVTMILEYVFLLFWIRSLRSKWGRTNGWMDRRKDKASFKVACP